MTPRRRCQRISAAFNAKARRLLVPGVVTGEMLAALPGECFYCGVTLGIMDGTWDHKVAFDKGGDNTLANIARCCSTCNRAKFTKAPEEFAAHQQLIVTCAREGCTNTWKPRYAERLRGMAKYCSRSCSAKSRWT